MCGIAGIVARGAVEEASLRGMAAALAHRGPDGEGIVRPPAAAGDWRAGLVHRRLAVFDPTPAGAQPMASRSGRTWIVLNGEIFNHPELRRRLAGFPWRTRTDTEVLLELFEAQGPEAFRQANGIFAAAFWEPEPGRLTLVRDRLGVKPLFHRNGPRGMAFASELAVLLVDPRAERHLDRAALSAYLDFGFAPSPRTLVRGIAKLQPGTLLVWERGRARIERWWSLPAPEQAGPRGWREGLYAKLVDAVRLQLRSDVPVGSFLSGGLDSTLVTALAVRERGSLDTFSARFPECPRLDEGDYARRAARFLGTRHHEVAIRGDEVRRSAPALVARLDEPLADSSLLPVSLLARAARERVTVVLAGDGADELFAGYRRYRAEHWLARWQRLPAPLRQRVVGPLLRRLGEDRASRLGELGRRARKLLEAEGLSEPGRAFALGCLFRAVEKQALVPGLDGDGEAGFAHFCELRARLGGRDGLDARLRVDLCLGLPDDMLVKVDRGSMAHGLEVRVPFLDHRVVEHAVRLPSLRKQRGGRGKLALLDVFGPRLPAAVRRRAKAGFDAPVGGWIRGALGEFVADTLAPERLRRTGWLDSAAVSRLVQEHARRRADHAWRIWSLVVLTDWGTRHRVA